MRRHGKTADACTPAESYKLWSKARSPKRGYALATLSLFKQRVQTYFRTFTPSLRMRTFCRFGSNRRLVATIEWLRLCPKLGPLPHESQIFDIRRRIIAGLGPKRKRQSFDCIPKQEKYPQSANSG